MSLKLKWARKLIHAYIHIYICIHISVIQFKRCFRQRLNWKRVNFSKTVIGDLFPFIELSLKTSVFLHPNVVTTFDLSLSLSLSDHPIWFFSHCLELEPDIKCLFQNFSSHNSTKKTTLFIVSTSFKVWPFASNNHGGARFKKKKNKHLLTVWKKWTLGHVAGEWRRP